MRLASNLIMTRLLVPEMFGVMALANVFIFGLYLFSDVGLRQNIVQSHRGHVESFLNTIWTIQIIRGFVIWLLAMLLSGAMYGVNLAGWWPQDSAYAEPLLPLVIAALSFNAIISGFESTNLATASRNLAIKRATLIDIVSQFLGISFMMAWALFDRSIWAMVAGSIMGVLVKTVLTHTSLPGIRNKLHWDWDDFHEIFNFGKWVFVTSVLGFLSSSGDRLMLGGIMDAAMLGFYSIAYFIFAAMKDMMGKLTSSVVFPALSEVGRDRPAELKATYYKFRLLVDAMLIVAMGFLFAVATLIIDVLYDSRYLPAGAMLQILAVGLFVVRYDVTGQCFIAIGKPKLLAPLMIIHLMVLYALLPAANHYFGITAALWVIGAGGMATIPLTIFYKIKYGLFDWKKELVVLPLLPLGYLLGIAVVHIFRSLGWSA